MTGNVLTCRAPRKHSKAGVQCGGFVADISGPFQFTRLLEHSGRKQPGADVVPCQRCGALHEIQRNPIARTQRAV